MWIKRNAVSAGGNSMKRVVTCLSLSVIPTGSCLGAVVTKPIASRAPQPQPWAGHTWMGILLSVTKVSEVISKLRLYFHTVMVWILFLPKIICEILTLKDDSIRRWGLWDVIKPWGWSLQECDWTFTKEQRDVSSIMWRHSEKVQAMNQDTEPQQKEILLIPWSWTLSLQNCEK